MIPDCTLTTSCFDLTSYHSDSRSIELAIKNMTPLLEIPCYLVIYTDSHCFFKIKTIRDSFGHESLTHYIVMNITEFPHYYLLDNIRENRKVYWPTKDKRTCPETHLLCCSKFDFVLQTIQNNPFQTSRFGWIDSNVGPSFQKIGQNYKDGMLLPILHETCEKFHIQVMNVVNKKYLLKQFKKEYYNQYRWIVCGCLFITGKEVGTRILHRLNQLFLETTLAGYGHGEEMLYLEVLEEFPNELVKSYGDYSHLLNNYTKHTVGNTYIFEFIIQRYLELRYYKECYECCRHIINSFPEDKNHRFYFLLLHSFYTASYYYKPTESKRIVETIKEHIEKYPQMRIEYETRKHFYDVEFAYV